MPRSRVFRPPSLELDHELDEVADIGSLYWDHPDYGRLVTGAFNFFRRNADGHYSDNTLMSLSRTAATWSDNINRDTPEAERHLSDTMPVITHISTPVGYDELTEIKLGGTIGMAVSWPHKTIVAVTQNYRRKHVGSKLLSTVRYNVSTGLSLWVGRNNMAGHFFCLTNGLYPTAMNSRGALRYGQSDSADTDEM